MSYLPLSCSSSSPYWIQPGSTLNSFIRFELMAAAAVKPTGQAELRESLLRHNEVFEGLLKLIPAKYYIVQDDPEVRSRLGTPA
jgi:hypothetical protein